MDRENKHTSPGSPAPTPHGRLPTFRLRAGSRVTLAVPRMELTMNLPAKAGFAVRCRADGTPNGKSHLWTGDDTACRMWSTGGLQGKHKYRYFIAAPTDFCHNCHAERHGITKPEEATLFALT